MSEMAYDRKMVEDLLDKCQDKEGMREVLNIITELLSIPTENATKIFCNFKRAGLETLIKHGDILDAETANKIINGVTSSFIMSILGNLMNVFEVSPKEMQRCLDMTIKQTENINKQEKDNI